MGRLIHVYHQMHEATRAGARLYSVLGNAEMDIRDMVDVAMSHTNLENSQYMVDLDPEDVTSVVAPLTEVTVSISVPFDQICWLAGNAWLSGKTLQAKTTMPFDPTDAADTGGGGSRRR